LWRSRNNDFVGRSRAASRQDECGHGDKRSCE
jgi:hypothetical protein